jgi:hypothetical protein
LHSFFSNILTPQALESEEQRLVAEKKRLSMQRDTLMRQVFDFSIPRANHVQNGDLASYLSRRSNERAVPSLPPAAPATPLSPTRVTMRNDDAAASLMMLAAMCPSA